MLRAGTGPGQGTDAFAIEPAGAITGNHRDASNIFHGFLRTTEGTITPFDAPGAGTGPFQGTVPFSINPAKTIAGFYLDGNNVYHGFLRDLEGTITTFNVSSAATGPGQGTLADDINPVGRSQGNTLTGTMCFTDSCALPMARSPCSMLRGRAQVLTKAP